jgi:hypothetical protein
VRTHIIVGEPPLDANADLYLEFQFSKWKQLEARLLPNEVTQAHTNSWEQEFRKMEGVFTDQPDGNILPDFLVDGRIAVEVRRLNENDLTESGGFRSLETDRISTGRKFRALLRALGPTASGTSWFVGCKLK